MRRTLLLLLFLQILYQISGVLAALFRSARLLEGSCVLLRALILIPLQVIQFPVYLILQFRADLFVYLLPESLLDVAEVFPFGGEVRLYVRQLLLGGGLLFLRPLGVVLRVHIEVLRVLDEHLGRLLRRADLVHFPGVFPRDDL